MTTYAVSRSPLVCTIMSDVFSGSREYALNISQAVIDASSDDSLRQGEYLPGMWNWSVRIDGLYIYTDLARLYLEQHLTDEEPIRIVVMFTPEDAKVFQGNSLVTNLTYISGFEDTMMINVDIKGTGLLVATKS